MNQIIDKILNRSILIILIVAVPINITTFLLLSDHPLHIFRNVNLVLGISILLLFLFRTKFNIRTKTGLLIAFVLLRGFYALCFGLLNISGLWFVLAIIFTLLVFNDRIAFGIYLITLLLTMATGISIVMQLPSFPVQQGYLEYGPGQVSINIIHFLLIGYLAYYIISNFIRNMQAEAEAKRNLNARYLNSVITIQEKERQRIAEDLHDGLAPALSGAKHYFQAYRDARHSEEKYTIAEKLDAILKNAIREVTHIAHNTSPMVLNKFGLKGAIDELINNTVYLSGITVDYRGDELPRFAASIELSLYRILTELINNTQKHACAKSITLQTKFDNKWLTIQYKDDGIGFDPGDVAGRGMGLQNIQTRINGLNGTLAFQKKEQSGIAIRIKIPVVNNQKEDEET
ncbi:MAG: sensor histidine kinase [Fidelibacterota bacterium]